MLKKLPKSQEDFKVSSTNIRKPIRLGKRTGTLRVIMTRGGTSKIISPVTEEIPQSTNEHSIGVAQSAIDESASAIDIATKPAPIPTPTPPPAPVVPTTSSTRPPAALESTRSSQKQFSPSELKSRSKISFGALTSYVIQGIDSILIRVEVSIVPGLPKFEIIGLPDTAIKESKERIIKSLIANGYKLPLGNITVNLSSAKIRKRGTLYDLPILLAILIASNQFQPTCDLKGFIIAGELSLEGKLQRVEGIFATVLQNIERQQDYAYLIPRGNEVDIKTITRLKKVSYLVASDLTEVLYALKEQVSAPAKPENQQHDFQESNAHSVPPHQLATEKFDFKEVAGNSMGKLALQLAAIARLNVLFIGTPGAGKSMLMERVPSILPALSFEDSLIVNRIYKAYLDQTNTFIEKQPFRRVHSAIHTASLIGGGRFPRPGEISLAHKGFLFLDELSEFERHVLQSLRTPIDTHSVTINRVEQQITFPCEFTLLACTNPCACGYYGDPIKQCVCSKGAISRFYGRLSGPLIDRFDIIIYISKLDERDFSSTQQVLSSATMRENIAHAISRTEERPSFYADLTLRECFERFPLIREIIKSALAKKVISMRKVQSILKIIHALELFYDREMDKAIVFQALELARNKLPV